MIILMKEKEFAQIDLRIFQIADFLITYDDETCTVRKNRKTGEVDVEYDLDEMALIMSEWI